MGKGRSKRKKQQERFNANKQAHQARLEKLERIKSTKQKTAGSASKGSAGAKASTSTATVGGSQKGKKGKKNNKEDSDTEDEEDIETILARFKREQEEHCKVTEEANAPPPSPRANASLTANPLNHNELIVFGGEHYNGRHCRFFNDLYRFNIEKGEWRRITSPNAPGPRSAHQAVATPTGQLYVFGGEFASASQNQFFHYKDFWMLTLATNEWQKLELDIKPSPRSGHRMVLWKSFLILFGGFYDTVRETRYYDDLWLFDMSEMKWIKVGFPENSPKPSSRSACQLFVIGDVLYLYGGYCKVFNKGEKAKGVVHTGVFDEDVTDERMVSVFYNDLISVSKGRTANSETIRTNLKRTVVTAVDGGGTTDGLEKQAEADDGGSDSGSETEQTSDLPSANATEPSSSTVPGTAGAETSDPSNAAPLYPAARFNAMLAVQRNVLYIFGGLVEVEDREVTLSDLYALNLDKLDKFEVLRSQPQEDGWDASASEDDEDDDSNEEDGDSEATSESEDGSSGEEDLLHISTEQIKEGSLTAIVKTTDASEASVSGSVVRASLPFPPAAESAVLAKKLGPSNNSGSATPPSAIDELNWDDDDYDVRPVATSAVGLSAGAGSTAANVKSAGTGREKRDALKAQLRVQNEEAMPRVDEPLADFYARTSTYWMNEAFSRDQQHIGFELAKETYEAMQPILKQMQELDLLVSDDDEKETTQRRPGRGGNSGQLSKEPAGPSRGRRT